METFTLASLLRMRRGDPHRGSPSGFGRLLATIGVIGLIYIGLQTASEDQASSFGLSQTAFATPEPLE